MKQFLAAFLAALMLLLCGCADPFPNGFEEEPRPDPPRAEQQKSTVMRKPNTDFNAKQSEPAEDAAETPSQSEGGAIPLVISTETQTADIEEIVSYSIDRPRITTPFPEIDAVLAEKIDEINEEFIRKCENDIYEKAQALPAMAIVTITCDAQQDGNLLRMDYEMQTEYRLSDPDAGEDPVSKGQRIVVYDLATGVFSEEG